MEISPTQPSSPPLLGKAMKVIPGYKKKKILTISDHPLIPSGVGLQSRYLIEGLLRTGKYSFRSWGAAMRHPDYRPQKVYPELYGDDWFIWPIDGYGDRERMRMFILNERPDALLIVTDPRFYTWLFEMADEVRQNMPIVYWHVWDNDPIPDYNVPYYECIDSVVSLSLKTHGIMQDLNERGLYDGRYHYVPHAIPPEQFKILPEDEVTRFKRDRLGPHADRKFILFWNNRNARRKMTGDVLDTFGQFLQKVGSENAALFMRTEPKDPEGQDIIAVAKKLGIDRSMIVSENKVSPEELCMFYNLSDCTINIANNEGFGLGTLESLMCGTPIVVQMTGGLQFQIGDWWADQDRFGNQNVLADLAKRRWKNREGKWWGVPVFPATRSCTGSQPIPYIYDDRVAHQDVVKALLSLNDMGRDARRTLGLEAREWALQNFNMDRMINDFDTILDSTIQAWRPPEPRVVSL